MVHTRKSTAKLSARSNGLMLNTDSIAYRLLLKIVAFSIISLLAVSIVQVYLNYQEEADFIERTLDRIEKEDLPAITKGLWVMDLEFLEAHLAGIRNKPNIVHAMIVVGGKTLVSAKVPHKDKELFTERDYPIVFAHEGRDIALGYLRIQASLDRTSPSNLFRRTVTRLLFQVLVIFSIAAFCFMIIRRDVTVHLESIAKQLIEEKKTGNGEGIEIKLNRGAGRRGDELGILTSAFNGMSRSMSDTLQSLERELAVNKTLGELSKALMHDTTLAEISRSTLEHSRILASCEHGYATVIDPASGNNTACTLTTMAGDKCNVQDNDRRIEFPRDQDGRYLGLHGRSLNTGEPFFTNNPSFHDVSQGVPGGHVPINNFLSVPVRYNDELVGQISLANARGGFTPEALSAIVRAGDLFALAIVKIRAEDRIRGSLKEKDVLLSEVHHRVKNNLAIISALLSLQSRYLDDPKSKLLIKESQSRITAMAMVHEKLYRQKEFARIDVGDYVRSLAENVITTFSIGRGIDIRSDVQDIHLEIDTLIPLGLIINELLTNSFKYAFEGFEGQNHPEIRISLQRLPDDAYLALSVEDNGKGLPAGFDVNNSGGLGLTIVRTLVEQIAGSFYMKSDEGTTTISIVFKEQPSCG